MRKFHPTHQKYDPEKNSVLRYVRAGLQPFSRPLFLGSAAALAVIAVCAGLYWQHPEWLDTTVEQPESLDEPGIDLDTADPPIEGLVDGNGAEIESESPQPPKNLLEQLNAEGGSSSIFPALGGAPSEGATETSPDLVERASFDNYRSFFEPKNGSSPSNLGEDRGGDYTSEITTTVQPAPVTDNPLQEAVDQVFSNQSESDQEREAEAVPGPSAPNTAQPQPNFDDAETRRQRVRDFNTFTDTSSSAPYGTVPLNPAGVNSSNLGTPNTSREPSNRPPRDRLNSYDFNNSFSPIDQPQGRFEQNNQERFEQNNVNNSSGQNYEEYEQNYLGTTEVVTPEVQEPIQVEQPQFEESPLFP